MAKEEKLTPLKVMDDFHRSYEAKRELIKRQREDFEFRLGKQWETADTEALKKKGILAITDNRIQSNIFLLTGLERQNRTDIKAYPEGAEDSNEAYIATALIKNVMKQSEGDVKFSEGFEDGITCGESGLEPFLDTTFNVLTPHPKWRKFFFDEIYPEPGWKEYDYSDCAFVNKWTRGIKKGDLIALYPEKEKVIEKMVSGSIRPMMRNVDTDRESVQYKDYPAQTRVYLEHKREGAFDLLERYYKKYVKHVFLVNHLEQTMTMVEPESKEDKRDALTIAKKFVRDVVKDDPDQKDSYSIIEKTIPEIWVAAMTGNEDDSEEFLVNERAWFFPRWKTYPFMTFFSHWNNVPLSLADRHLNVQGIVCGVKSTQQLHNKTETLKLRHLNSAANSGWLTEEGAWVDSTKVEDFGSTPGVNLEYKQGRPKPDRIFPMPISSGHEMISRNSPEAIKAQLGINSDLLASQESGGDSGRAIALRQRQGIIMVQKVFDNYSRTKANSGKFIMSQLGTIFTVESVKRVLGQAWVVRNFSRPDPTDQTGQTMELDKKKLHATIRKVLGDAQLGVYDVFVGEIVATETKRIADFEDIQKFAQQYPGVIDPGIIIEASQLPGWVKDKVLGNLEKMKVAGMMGGQGPGGGAPPPKPKPKGGK